MTDTNDFAFDFTDVDVDFEDTPELDAVPEDKEEEKPAIEVETPEDDLDKETKDEYLKIFDSIMFEDRFEKEYELGSRYKAVFATRSAEADMSISRQLDGMDFKTMHAFQTMSAVLTMSHSVIELAGTDMRGYTTAERYKFLRTKSSHLIELLADRLIKFDLLVRNALEYGEENF